MGRNEKCEPSRNLRIYVTELENVPKLFFALARFLSAVLGRGCCVKIDTIHAPFSFGYLFRPSSAAASLSRLMS